VNVGIGCRLAAFAGIKKGNAMKTIQKFARGTMVMALFISLSGCAGMTTQGRNTAIGAGAGALGGAAITGGSPLGTVGGAAVGGVIGHEISKPKKR
jgi:osmotically inducible lipoprotein OsmB